MASDSFDALLANHEDGSPPRVGTLSRDDLPEGDVLVRSPTRRVNYKDALAAIPEGQVARISPLVPGIDLAGTVLEARPAEGGEVLAHGYDLGVAHHGGFAQLRACRPSGSCRCPPG